MCVLQLAHHPRVSLPAAGMGVVSERLVHRQTSDDLMSLLSKTTSDKEGKGRARARQQVSQERAAHEGLR